MNFNSSSHIPTLYENSIKMMQLRKRAEVAKNIASHWKFCSDILAKVKYSKCYNWISYLFVSREMPKKGITEISVTMQNYPTFGGNVLCFHGQKILKSFSNDPLISWTVLEYFCHHFWVVLLLLCCCTHPKVMTKMTKKCSTDQRCIIKSIL